MTIMAQIGCFVPAECASFPIVHQLFARISTDDCLEANVSTFASEMREIAFILHNVEPRSLIIVDELGRGTSTTDGLAIAIAISEALIQSKAYVWFVTHFRDLPRILAERVGVYNLHTHVDIDLDFSRMKMKYKISEGQEEQKFYGLALAQLVDLPEQIMETAVQVSKALNARNDARRTNARTIAIAKKRKLAVHMRETLIQARNSSLEGRELLDKLRALQQEFTMRMTALDVELDVVELQQRQYREELDDTRTRDEMTPELDATRSPEAAQRESTSPTKPRIATSRISSTNEVTGIPSDPFQPMPTEPESETQELAGETLVLRSIAAPVKQESQSDWLMLHGAKVEEAIVIDDDDDDDMDEVDEGWGEI